MWNIELKAEKSKMIKKSVDIADALNKCYKYPSDIIVFRIADIELKLPIVYTFSDLLDDFLDMLFFLRSDKKGSGKYGFSQNTEFDADFNLNWDDDMLLIKFDWRFVNNIGISELPSEISVSKKEFINTWKELFEKLIIQLNLEKIKMEYYDEKENIYALIGDG